MTNNDNDRKREDLSGVAIRRGQDNQRSVAHNTPILAYGQCLVRRLSTIGSPYRCTTEYDRRTLIFT